MCASAHWPSALSESVNTAAVAQKYYEAIWGKG
jgi:hypothetical protein